MKHLFNYICEQLMIDENRVVTFDGKIYPREGWCVIMAGGPGSGKGYTKEHKILIDAKVIDVDELKKAYVKMHDDMLEEPEYQKYFGKNHKYDSHNPKDVAAVHQIVKDKGWKQKIVGALINQSKDSMGMGGRHYADGETLPNVIFDITGKDPNESVIEEICQIVKTIGWKTSLVWVVTTRAEAIIRNLERERRVPDKQLHQIHNKLMNDMPEFIQSQLAGTWLDDAWICWGSTRDIQNHKMSEQENKTSLLHLEKEGGKFILNKGAQKKLARYLGEVETNPENPEVYMNSDEIWKKYGMVITVIEKDKHGKEVEVQKNKIDRKAYGKSHMYQNKE